MSVRIIYNDGTPPSTKPKLVSIAITLGTQSGKITKDGKVCMSCEVGIPGKAGMCCMSSKVGISGKLARCRVGLPGV